MRIVNDYTIEQIAEGNHIVANLIEQDETGAFLQDIKVDEVVSDKTTKDAITTIINNITQRGESALRDNEMFILRSFGVVAFGIKKKITYRFALINAETGAFKSENNARSFIGVGEVEEALNKIDTYLVA